MNKFITSINAVSFKGQTFQQELAPLTIITGKNGKGKSARLEALTLAACGYVPGYSAKPGDIYAQFGNGKNMAVAVEGAINRELTWSVGSKGVKFIDDPIEPFKSVMLDPQVYFGLSGPARLRYLFDHCKSGDLEVGKVRDVLVANLKKSTFDGKSTEATEQAIGTLVAGLPDALGSATDWLTAVATYAGEQLKLAGQNVKRQQQTIQGLAQNMGEAEPAPADAEARLQAARAALEAATTALATIQAQGKEAAESLRKAQAIADTLVDESQAQKTLALIESKLAVNRAVQPAPKEFPVWRDGETDAALAKWSKVKEELFKKCAIGRPDPRKYFQELSDLSGAATEAALRISAAADKCAALREQLEEAKSAKCCATCGQDVTKLKKKIAAALQTQLNNALDEQSALEHAADKADKRYKVCRSLYDENQIAVAEWEADQAAFRDASQKHADLQKKIQDETDKACNKLNSEYTTAQSNIARLTTEKSSIEKKLAENSKAIEAANSLMKLGEQTADLRFKYQEQEVVVTSKRGDVSAADLLVKRRTAQLSAAKEQASATEALASAQGFQTVAKEFASMVSELQAKILDTAIKPVMDEVNRLCAPLLGFNIVYKDGEILVEDKERDALYSHRAGSDSEQMLIYAAFCIALASMSEFKLCCIGKLEAFDWQRKSRLAGLLLDMIEAGTIHQAVIIEVDGIGTAAIGWDLNLKGIKNVKVVEL